MAASADALVTLTRGMAVDKSETGSPVIFTEAEVIESINQAKHDLFGRRPDAFSTLSPLTEEPPDIESARISLPFTYGETTVVLQHLASSLGGVNLDEGAIALSVKTGTADGTILYFGDSGTNYLHAYVTGSKLKVDVYDSSEGESATITMDEYIANGSWNNLTIEADGALLTVTDGFGNEKTAAYAGDLIPGSDQAYLGFSHIGTVETYFGGSMSDLVITDNALSILLQLDMDDGSGPTLEDASGSGYDADIHHDGDDMPWTTVDALEVASWAEMPLCYLASSILMTQKSKDTYFRKAADQNLQKYMGSI